MARFDAYNSECLVFSFKDGLLARLAHDLKLQVERFSIEVDDSTHGIKATFDPSSLQVVCAQVDGRDDPSTLSKGDKKKIYDNATKDVLQVRKYPEIRFDSSNVVARAPSK
jgi:polyisoprenoid-binding protein YceI